MAVIDEKTKEQVKNMLKDLKNEVTLVVFTQESLISTGAKECETCKDNRLLMEEVASLSDKIRVEVFDYAKDKNKVEEYGIDKIPATVIKGDRDRGIRIFGLPAGYEFPTLLSAIKLVSAAESDLSDGSRTSMKKITKPVHIQVFVTLTCPYCASAAHLAHRLAHQSEMVKADVINAQEFPQLAQKYNVFAVPKIVINESIQFEGALPEEGFVAKVLDSQNSEK